MNYLPDHAGMYPYTPTDMFSTESAPSRKPAIEGIVETSEQTEQRLAKEREAERQRIKTERKGHADTCRKRQRSLQRKISDYRLSIIGLVATAALAVPVVTGWTLALAWGMASNLGGGRGGPMWFFGFALLVISAADIVGIACCGVRTYKGHHGVVAARNEYSDALEASLEFDLENPQ